MNTPNTKTARKLIKIALDVNNARYLGCWTDKTSKFDKNRRSVSFMISDLKADAILATLKKIYEDLGYDSPVKLTTSETNLYHRSGGNTYIRAIATLDNKLGYMYNVT
jgi:hypothetical protein